jgi:putative ABC transport system substrate-binding protein
MVATGLIRSLSNPGGNTTGVSIFATELDGKRQEILIELLPNAHQMAVLADSRTTAPPQLEALQNAARARGVELSMHLDDRFQEGCHMGGIHLSFRAPI